MKYFAILLLALSVNILSQVNQEWVTRYNQQLNYSDDAYSIAVDHSGNVYVTGESFGILTDYATIKYNSSGIQQWVQRYDGPGNSFDRPHSIAIDGSGNVYVTGSSAASGLNDDFATVKYDPSGVLMWVQRYNGPGNGQDIAYSVAVDGLGNIFVTGSSKGTGNEDYATIKYNTLGEQQWLQRYDGPGNSIDYASSLAVDGPGNVYVTGYSYGGGTYLDYATIKYNTTGVQQWAARYTGPGSGTDRAYSIAVDASGNVYVTGYSNQGATLLDYATIKYNSSGVQQWVQFYNGTGNDQDRAYSIAVDVSGNVFVTGYSIGNGTHEDYATIKYNSSGAQQWVRIYNEVNGTDIANSIAVDGYGNVYVTGLSVGNAGLDDYATIKYNSSGILQWVQRYNFANGSDAAVSLTLDASGNVYVTGSSMGSGTGIDYATIKYSQSTGIHTISNEVPGGFSLSQNYPNPFNPNTVIRFNIKESEFTSLKVYDILGKEVESLVNEELNPGTYEVNWNAEKFSSGIYYCRLSAGDFSNIKKMILIK